MRGILSVNDRAAKADIRVKKIRDNEVLFFGYGRQELLIACGSLSRKKYGNIDPNHVTRLDEAQFELIKDSLHDGLNCLLFLLSSQRCL